MVAVHPRVFSINEGGPFDHLIRKLHLLKPSGMVRVWWVVAVAWLPLMLGATLRMLVGLPLSPIVLDISVHARFLIAAPLLLFSLALLEPQCRGVIRMLYEGGFADPVALDPIVDRGERLRGSAAVELSLAAVALVVGQLGLWGVLAPTGLVAGIEAHREWSFARVWYGTVSEPLVQFLMLRWYWRWGVWTYMLVKISRLQLAATATHPDHAAGLSFFAWPVGGYSWFVTAIASVLAGAWGTQLLDGRLTVPSLGPTLLVFIVIALVIGYVPLFMFSPHIYRARRRDLAAHGLFALQYVRDFDARWIAGRPGESPLGTSDIQSLADVGNAFQVVLTTRLTVFHPLRIKNIVIAAVLPMLPLIATVVPLEKVVSKLGGALLGLPM